MFRRIKRGIRSILWDRLESKKEFLIDEWFKDSGYRGLYPKEWNNVIHMLGKYKQKTRIDKKNKQVSEFLCAIDGNY